MPMIAEIKEDAPHRGVIEIHQDPIYHDYGLIVGSPGNDWGDITLTERMRDELVKALNDLKFS